MRQLSWFGGLLGSGLLLAVTGSATTGCTTEAVCFDDCTRQAPITDGGMGNTGTGGLAGNLSLGGKTDSGGSTGGSQPEGGEGGADPGPNCGDLDLTSDVNNCGACGNPCILFGVAESACVNSECVVTTCNPGNYDDNGNPEDGCELICDGDPNADEVCDQDDNDCDGDVDEGFDLTSDVEHCGVCNNACDLFRASESCESSLCTIVACDEGYVDVDGLDSTGCEYPCHPKDKDGNECDPATADVALGCGIEVCDTIDQDCDGSINDNTVDSGQPCSDYCPGMNCQGLCTAGAYTCVGTDLVCVPGEGPKVDICDGMDNNCDGTPDEDFDLDSDTEHCGDCNTSCVGTLLNALAKCENQVCVIDVCNTDYGNLDANAPGCELCPVTPVRSESCNGKDDDCDGQTDEAAEVNLTKPASGAGAGVNSFCKQRAGSLCHNVPLVCDSVTAKAWVCQYPAGVETGAGKVLITEGRCDGIDGNCDGQVDEAFLDLGTLCDDAALGVCLDHGEIACDPLDSSKTYCDTSELPDPPGGAPFATESCNGLDDNCDGDVDEGTDDMVHITRNGLDFWIDKYEASRPDASDDDAGSVESHLCGIPNRMPWTDATFDEAQTACEGSDKRLCDIEELEEACKGATNRTYPYGNVYNGTHCNGIDTPGSAPAPTGSLPNCVSTDGVYDLSGNVAEWSSQVEGTTTGNPPLNIMALQGGSYLTPQNGLTCTFDLDRITTNAVLPSIGFRCCKDP